MPARVRIVLVAVFACALAALGGVWVAAFERAGERSPVGSAGFAGAVRPPGAGVPSFALRDQDGRVVRWGAFAGRPVVFTFIYSTCEDTCPIQVQQIRGALDSLGRDVAVLGVSVDPAGDTPERARRFLAKQRMTGRMRFLLGSEARLRPLWRAFGIAPQRGELDHSAYVVLVDGRGRQRVGFPASQLTVDRLAHDLRRLGA